MYSTAAASAAVLVSPPDLRGTAGRGGGPTRRRSGEMTRVFSGIQPTGNLTLGNYLGAMRRWAEADQYQADALFCVVDLHALTVEHDPARVRRLSRQAATLLLASGLDPALCTLFVQSHVD